MRDQALGNHPNHTDPGARLATARGLRAFLPLTLLLASLIVLLPLGVRRVSAREAEPAAGLASALPQSTAPGSASPLAVTWTSFSPTGWATALPLTVTVTAEAPGGLEPSSAAFGLSTDTGGTWSAWSTLGLTVGGAVSTTQAITIADLNLPNSAAGNLIRFQIGESGGITQTSPSFTIRVDTIPPTSTIASPNSGAVLAVSPVIQGTASDAGGSGVSSVTVAIRSAASGLYWSGAAWLAGEQWLGTLGTLSWTFAGPQPAWESGVSYSVTSRAVDGAGLLESPGPGVNFAFDTTSPAVTMLIPNGGELLAGGDPYSITWSATDNVGLAAQPITLSVSYDAGATWSPIANAISNTGSYSWSPPAIDSTRVLVQVGALDRAGNLGTDRSNSVFTVASSASGAPLGLEASPASWSNSASFTVTWTNPQAPAPIAGAWYKLDLPPFLPGDGRFVTTTNIITGIVPAGDSTHPIYVWLQDALGHADYTRNSQAMLYVDRTAPPPPSAFAGSPARTWTSINSFAERWTNPPDLSGIAGAYYRLDRPGMSATDGAFVTTTNTIGGITVPDDGKHDLYIWLVDAAGNVDQNNRNIDPQVFWFDGTAPVSSVALTPTLPASGWYSTTVAATFAATDTVGGSGVAAVMNQLDNMGWSTLPTLQILDQAAHRLSYYATDVAGNMEPTHTITISLDLAPPNVAVVPSRLPPASGWYTAPVTLTLRVTDTLSGLPSAFYQLDSGPWQSSTALTGPSISVSIPITVDGDYQLGYYGQDAAGNRSPAGMSHIRLDATAPATAYQVIGTQGQNGWYASPLTVRLIPEDPGSGIDHTYYRVDNGLLQTGTVISLTADGLYTLSFYSVDLAGNVESSFPVAIKLDSTPPAAPSAVVTAPDGWSRDNRFGVQWANPTDLSGIEGVLYRLDQEPAAPDDGIFLPVTNRLDNLTVPGEGAHPLYLWLRDVAGNADQHNRAPVQLLRYDATPPTTTLQIQGLAGDNGWYRSAITVTLDAQDAQSGVVSTLHKLDGGAWITGTSLSIAAPDKHVLEYGSRDAAGNIEPIHEATLRIDPNPPGSPTELRAEPTGWTQYNSFRLTWRDPSDQSGIAGSFVHFDGPPSGPSDGTFYAVNEVLNNLRVPAEGKHSVYVWLRDVAGNADERTAVALPSSLWYDGTPPITDVTVTGSIGQNGWYLGPVTFAMTATDTASGLGQIRWQIDDSPWNSASPSPAGGSFVIDTDGQHVVRVTSVDNAGNTEPAHIYQTNIDRQAPQIVIGPLSHYQPSTRFAVTWPGPDPSPGSGLGSYDVQLRRGLTGSWEPWLTATQLTGAQFTGERGHSYYFRVRGRDRAGNEQQFTGGSAYTVIESVLNGRFDTGTFADWSSSGDLFKSAVPLESPSGATSFVASLGTPDYGPSPYPNPGPGGGVPPADATIVQTVAVPSLTQVVSPTLSFWYRIYTYDVLYSQRHQKYWDSFEVSVRDTSGQPLALLLRDGNPTQNYGTLYDTGWRHITLDLRPYAGQTVQLAFANYNRFDIFFNTWSLVDNISLQDWPYSHPVFLPQIFGAGPAAAGSIAPNARVVVPGQSGATPADTSPSPTGAEAPKQDGKR